LVVGGLDALEVRRETLNDVRCETRRHPAERHAKRPRARQSHRVAPASASETNPSEAIVSDNASAMRLEN